MAETQTKSTKGQDAEKAQEKKRRLEPAPVPMKALAGEPISFPGLLGVSAMELPIERHAALLGDPRFSHSVNNSQKAGLVTELQQNYGNAYVQRVVGRIQAKKDEALPEEEPDLADIVPKITAEKGSGKPLEPETRSEMEASFGKDFSDVRIHANPTADKLAEELGARAFTTGKDVFFREGAYQPTSEAGKGLLGHELAHVMQQASGIGGRSKLVGQVGDALEEEAARASRVVGEGRRVYVETASAVPALQRQEAKAPEAEKKEKGEEEGKLTQRVYRFEVCFVDDGRRAKLQVGEEQEEAEVGKKEEGEGKGAPNVQSYGYIQFLPWAWEASTKWENGRTVKVEDAEKHARAAIKSAEESIDKSKLDESQKKVAKDKLREIADQIPKCFTERARELPRRRPIVPIKEEDAKRFSKSLYLGEMNKGVFTSIEFLEDKVTFKAGGGPAKPPEVPEAVVEVKPEAGVLVIDGFPFAKAILPADGEVKLQEFCEEKVPESIVIESIEGWADQSGTEKVNKPLSERRAQSVRKYLEGKFGPGLPAAVGKGEVPEVPGGVPETELKEKRKVDRKVVIRWRTKSP